MKHVPLLTSARLAGLILCTAITGLSTGCASSSKAPVPLPDTTGQHPIDSRIDSMSPGLADIHFDSDQSQLRLSAGPTLTAAADYMKNHPSKSLVLSGHTDSTGKDFSNQILSILRARAVKDALIVSGIPAQRIVVEGYGETAPARPNSSAPGRQVNRRVEFEFVDTTILRTLKRQSVTNGTDLQASGYAVENSDSLGPVW